MFGLLQDERFIYPSGKIGEAVRGCGWRVALALAFVCTRALVDDKAKDMLPRGFNSFLLATSWIVDYCLGFSAAY